MRIGKIAFALCILFALIIEMAPTPGLSQKPDVQIHVRDSKIFLIDFGLGKSVLFAERAGATGNAMVYHGRNYEDVVINSNDIGDCIIISTSTPIDAEVLMDGMFAAAKTTGAMIFNALEGKTGSYGDSDDYCLMLTMDKSPLPKWDIFEVRGTNNKNVLLELTEDGYLLEGEYGLQEIRIKGKKGGKIRDACFSTDKQRMMIDQQDGKLAAWIDNDNDGTYETPLESFPAPKPGLFDFLKQLFESVAKVSKDVYEILTYWAPAVWDLLSLPLFALCS